MSKVVKYPSHIGLYEIVIYECESYLNDKSNFLGNTDLCGCQALLVISSSVTPRVQGHCCSASLVMC